MPPGNAYAVKINLFPIPRGIFPNGKGIVFLHRGEEFFNEFIG
jgi:hypothetical protein